MSRILRGYITTIAVRAGGEDFELVDSTESAAFSPNHAESTLSTEYEMWLAIQRALQRADQECYAGRLSWRKDTRLAWLLHDLNRYGYWVNEREIRQHAGNRL